MNNHKRLRIQCITHAAFEGPGGIQDWFVERGHFFQITRVFAGEPLPDPETLDLLVVMGGPMSVHDVREHPWLHLEKALIRRCLGEGRFVLGVCLGSQLLAECLGAAVRPNRCKEIGWFPVTIDAGGSRIFGSLPQRLQVFHWHGETYDLPERTELRASSLGCSIQAFEHESGVGLQFHLEVRPAEVDEMLKHCGDEIGEGEFECPPERVLLETTRHWETARAALESLLGGIVWKLAGDSALGEAR